MYVTVVCDPGGRPAAYGPTATANLPTLPDDGALACTTPLCPPSGLDRTTGRVTDPSHIRHVDRALAAAIAAARPSPDPRQLTNCERALLPNMQIVLRFYDLESSRKELTQRGSSTAWQMEQA